MYFAYFDDRNRLLGGNFRRECAECIKACDVDSQIKNCPLAAHKRRQGVVETSSGKSYLCSDSHKHLKSAKVFKKDLHGRAELLLLIIALRDNFDHKASTLMSRQIHNLTTLNAQCIQEVYDFISQDTLSQTKQSDQMSKIKLSIEKDLSSAAKLFTKILKNNNLMKTEFSVFRKLTDLNPQLQKRPHVIHKVVLNVFHSFFADFSDKDVTVNIQQCPETVGFDYESITAALFHMISNSLKYILPKSRLDIEFDRQPNQIRLIFKMRSLGIDPDEIEKIFEDGYSGKRAKALNIAGDGRGLHIVKSLVELNGGTIYPQIGDMADTSLVKGVPFPINQFVIALPMN